LVVLLLLLLVLVLLMTAAFDATAAADTRETDRGVGLLIRYTVIGPPSSTSVIG